MKDEDIDEFFGESEEEVETEATNEAEEKAEAEDSKVDDVPHETSEEDVEEQAETTAEKDSDTSREPTMVPLAALQDERRKNQQLKERLEQFEKQYPQHEEEPDMFEDPDAYKAYVRRQAEQEIAQREENARRQKLDSSRSKMLETASDYEEMEKVFEIMTINDRSLVQQMVDDKDPARFAYDKAKAYLDEVIGSKVQGKTVTEVAETVEKKSNVTKMPNLAKETNVASNSVNVEKEEGLDDIWGDQKY